MKTSFLNLADLAGESVVSAACDDGNGRPTQEPAGIRPKNGRGRSQDCAIFQAPCHLDLFPGYKKVPVRTSLSERRLQAALYKWDPWCRSEQFRRYWGEHLESSHFAGAGGIKPDDAPNDGNIRGVLGF